MAIAVCSLPSAARRDGGAATVLAVGTLAALVLAFGVPMSLAAVLGARHIAMAGADAAALAAADTALGAVPGIPCDRAAAVASADGTRLASCLQSGDTVAVQVAVEVLGSAIVADARAGPATPRSGVQSP